MPIELKKGLTLYFCRHGETEAKEKQNEKKREDGNHLDTSQINPNRENNPTRNAYP